MNATTPPIEPMEPEELREALATLGWSQQRCATEMGINERTVRRWCSTETTPPSLAAWIRRLVAKYAAGPAKALERYHEAVAKMLADNPPPPPPPAGPRTPGTPGYRGTERVS